MAQKNSNEEKEEIKKELKEEKIGIAQFCEELQLPVYHSFAFKKTFSEDIKKTKTDWKKFLVDKKLISVDLFK